MWFKLAMLVDGKTEPQKEMACSGSQRKPGEVLEASPQPDPPRFPVLGSLQCSFCVPFHLHPLHIFSSKKESYFCKNSDFIRPYYIQASI